MADIWMIKMGRPLLPPQLKPDGVKPTLREIWNFRQRGGRAVPGDRADGVPPE